MARSRRREVTIDYWPGFVDALSSMLLVIILLMSVFMLAQYFLSREVTGKDTALVKLNKQIEELTSLLALERAAKGETQANVLSLNATLEASSKEQARLRGLLDANGAANVATGGAARLPQRRWKMKSRCPRKPWRRLKSSTSRSAPCAASWPLWRMH